MDCVRIQIGIPFSTAAPDDAPIDPWESEVDPHTTTRHAVLEVANGHRREGSGTFLSPAPWYNANKLTYRLTDRIETAAHLNFAQPSGHCFWWARNKAQLRCRLFNEGVLPVGAGWYAEPGRHRALQFDSADPKLELKSGIEKDFERLALVGVCCADYGSAR